MIITNQLNNIDLSIYHNATEDKSMVINATTYSIGDKVAGFSWLCPNYEKNKISLTYVDNECRFMIGELKAFKDTHSNYNIWVNGNEYISLISLADGNISNESISVPRRESNINSDGKINTLNENTIKTVNYKTLIKVPDGMTCHKDIARYCLSIYKLFFGMVFKTSK